MLQLTGTLQKVPLRWVQADSSSETLSVPSYYRTHFQFQGPHGITNFVRVADGVEYVVKKPPVRTRQAPVVLIP